MNRHLFCVLALLLLCADPRLRFGLVSAQEKPPTLPEDVQKSKQLLEDHLGKLKNGMGAQLTWLKQEPLPELLPNYRLFVVRYRVYPVGKARPQGLAPSSVFAVSKEGTLTHLKDTKTLQEFFSKNLPAGADEKTARSAVKAALLVAQEFKQDGFYKFTIIDESLKVENKDGGREATGKAIVMQGGNGDVQVKLVYDAAGKLTELSETTKLKPGPRPICQATKLLDADPIVRRMAEEDLLYMGLPAHDYLMEQRALAGPELRQAIDRIRQRIVTEGW